MNDLLEDKLSEARGPAMPADVERRIRARLAAEPPPHRPWGLRRLARRGSYGQLLLLLALLMTAGWVLRHDVLPVLRAGWERAHCLIDPSSSRR